MTWNYRIVRHRLSQPNEFHYQVHEVYYDGDGNVELISEFSVSPYGESVVDLISDYAKMAEAFKKPVIDYETREELAVSND